MVIHIQRPVNCLLHVVIEQVIVRFNTLNLRIALLPEQAIKHNDDGWEVVPDDVPLRFQAAGGAAHVFEIRAFRVPVGVESEARTGGDGRVIAWR